MYQSKIFHRNFNTTINEKIQTADEGFNEWMKEHPNVKINSLDYRHTTHGNHSILIIYNEEDI